MGQNMGEEDQRDVELSSLAAIFPELQVDEQDGYSFSLEIPVNPLKNVTVSFPAAAAGPTGPGAAGSGLPAASSGAGEAPRVNQIDSHSLSYLPPVVLRVSLPQGYPAERPPKTVISTSPPWLPDAVVRGLEGDATRLWSDLGRDLVVFSYIDHIQQVADAVFGLVDDRGSLEVDPQHKITILNHDIRAKKAAFDRGTFDCGVCLDPKKGASCHRMVDCGHVFCVSCLQDFYGNAIKEGDLASVRCLQPNCAKEREEAGASPGKRRRKAKTTTFVSPSELLQIPLDAEVVKRYVALKYKTELESDKSTIYCPRPWCGGAARSKKHKKPDVLALASPAPPGHSQNYENAQKEKEEKEEEEEEEEEDEEEEEEGEQEEGGNQRAEAGASSSSVKAPAHIPTLALLAVCEDCGFAFCSRCYLSWHGEFIVCRALPRNQAELSAEERASLEYVALHTSLCPTCEAPCQKTRGCNHMICYRCRSHFCYLCSAWLDPSNPYGHFGANASGRRTGCFNRLWELEDGDGDGDDAGDAHNGLAGGRVPAAALAIRRGRQLQQMLDENDGGEEDDEDGQIGLAGLEPDDELGDDGLAGQDGADNDGDGGHGGDDGNDGAAEPEAGEVVPMGVAREGPLVLRIAANPPPAGAAAPGTS